uniref:SMP-LTD domain-containing protein n=1 Tax=Esox lucius TaxID=8010 RepID=A0AAY5K9J2_ESOLU
PLHQHPPTGSLPQTSQGLPVTLYLFGRTGREKEEWFQHFLLAARPEVKSSPIRDVSKSGTKHGGSSSGTIDDLPPLLGLQDYTSYMSRLIGFESGSPAPSPSAEGCPTAGHPAWVNALVGRIFWDFLREKYWVDMVAHKIQKKLSKIRLPYFVNELKLADLDMGTCIPQLLSISKPSLDHRGLWLELEVVYTGCLQMTLETKLNLCKLGKERCIGVEADRVLPEARRVGLCVLADSDEESSSAGSSDEEEVPPTEPQGILGENGGSTGKRFLRFVDKIASSKYFQKATENEYIKKKIAEVSNMPLMLTVEVLELSGTLAVNIPPPPTDRICFRVPPRLDLRVRPMLGEREVTFTHVTDWIEKKLGREFQICTESFCPLNSRCDSTCSRLRDEPREGLTPSHLRQWDWPELFSWPNKMDSFSDSGTLVKR